VCIGVRSFRDRPRTHTHHAVFDRGFSSHSGHTPAIELCASCLTHINRIRSGRETRLAHSEPVPTRNGSTATTATTDLSELPHAQVNEDAPMCGYWSQSTGSRHEFVAGNFFMATHAGALPRDLQVSASAVELNVAADRTVNFLQTQAAHVSIGGRDGSGRLETRSLREPRGHKSRRYPSRRHGHFIVRTARSVVFSPLH